MSLVNKHPRKQGSRTFWVMVLLIILLPVLFLVDLKTGSFSIDFTTLIRALLHPDKIDPQTLMIISQFRLPKAITAVLAGSALSIAGLQMQTVFRNPLAGPSILGVSSGASLGVALFVMGLSGLGAINPFALASSWSIVTAAWIGAAIILLLMLIISSKIKDIMAILILGILLSSAISAFVNILQYFSHESLLKSFVIWTMGSLGSVTNDQLIVMAPAVILGMLLAIAVIKFLDAFLLGDQYAMSLGMNIQRARTLIFLSTAILAGTITAFCGPIGFIGIAVPHLARIALQTSRHQWLIPASLLLGASMMLASDMLTQLPGSDRILPINAVTALLGIPIVIWIIFRNKSTLTT